MTTCAKEKDTRTAIRSMEKHLPINDHKKAGKSSPALLSILEDKFRGKTIILNNTRL